MNRYRPRTLEEMARDPIPVTWLNEPVPPDNVRTLVPKAPHSLHAVLCDALTSNRGLLARLDQGGC